MNAYIISYLFLLFILCPWVNFHLNIAIECLNIKFCTQYGLGDSDVLVSEDVRAIALEVGMRLYLDLYH